MLYRNKGAFAVTSSETTEPNNWLLTGGRRLLLFGTAASTVGDVVRRALAVVTIVAKRPEIRWIVDCLGVVEVDEFRAHARQQYYD